MEDKPNKDILILKLLVGWEIIHLSKSGKKVSIRLREFPEKDSRFFRIIFNGCSVAAMLIFNQAQQIKDFKDFEFKGCIFLDVHLEYDGIINIHLLKENELVGSLKILPDQIDYDFTSK